MKLNSTIVKALLIVLPWKLRRLALRVFYKYELHPTARIGLSWVYPDHLIMHEGAVIGHLNVIKGLSLLVLSDYSLINRLNWITGYSLNSIDSFNEEANRSPELHLAEHSAITNRHLIDCTNKIELGKYSIIAGFRSQILTHSIDFEKGIQTSEPVNIGSYSFVGTASVILKGSSIPDNSIVGAMSLVNKKFDQHGCLYGGVPAVFIKKLRIDGCWFDRILGTIR